MLCVTVTILLGLENGTKKDDDQKSADVNEQ